MADFFLPWLRSDLITSSLFPGSKMLSASLVKKESSEMSQAVNGKESSALATILINKQLELSDLGGVQLGRRWRPAVRHNFKLSHEVPHYFWSWETKSELVHGGWIEPFRGFRSLPPHNILAEFPGTFAGCTALLW